MQEVLFGKEKRVSDVSKVSVVSKVFTSRRVPSFRRTDFL